MCIRDRAVHAWTDGDVSGKVPRYAGRNGIGRTLTDRELPHRLTALVASAYQRPTRPVTDAINFAGSKPTPFLKTVSTLRMSAIVVDGSPATITRSACFPTAIVPM